MRKWIMEVGLPAALAVTLLFLLSTLTYLASEAMK